VGGTQGQGFAACSSCKQAGQSQMDDVCGGGTVEIRGFERLMPRVSRLRCCVFCMYGSCAGGCVQGAPFTAVLQGARASRMCLHGKGSVRCRCSHWHGIQTGRGGAHILGGAHLTAGQQTGIHPAYNPTTIAVKRIHIVNCMIQQPSVAAEQHPCQSAHQVKSHAWPALQGMRRVYAGCRCRQQPARCAHTRR
jgi:hypothetical protein